MPTLKSSQSSRSEAAANESLISGDTTSILQRNPRRPLSVSDNRRPRDDVGTSSPRKPNVSRPRGTRPSSDNIPASGRRAQSTHRSNRLTDDGDKSSKTKRPKSLLRCRASDNTNNDTYSPILRNKEQKKDTHHNIEGTEESSRRSVRPKSVRRCRATEDGSVSAVRTLKPTSEQTVRSAQDTTQFHATRPKSVQRDRLLDSNPIAAVPKRKDIIRPNQRPRKDPTIDYPNDPLNRESTKSQIAVVDESDKQVTLEKERRNSTTIPRSNGTDRRRRCSTADINDSVQVRRPVNKDRRKSDFARSSDLSNLPTKDPSQFEEPRRHSRTHMEQGNINAEKPRPRRGDIRKHKSSPDMDTIENIEQTGQKAAAITKSKSVRNGSTVKNTSEREKQIVKRSIVRKPSIKIPENHNSDHNESDSSHNIIVPAAVIQFDPTQQSGVVVIAPKEEKILQEEKEVTRKLVRKPSLSLIISGNDTEQASEIIDHQSGMSQVWKPSQGKYPQESHEDDGNDDSSSASTVFQFVPSHKSSVAHANPHENDDCVSVASEMENSWAAPILAFHDSDGEELDEKPISRRHNNSTKLLNSIQQRRPSMTDSVHTKSSESHTTSSSLGRPQYYAPPLRNPSNTANSLAATFAEFIEKDQSIDELNTNGTGDNFPVKSKSRKKNRNDEMKVDADDEKSQVGQKTKPARSVFKKDVIIDRKKSLLSTSNHSTHSLLASDSDDDSYDDDRRMSNVFKPTPLNDMVHKNAVPMTAYESETENDSTTTTKKGKGSGIGKYFFGGGGGSSSSNSNSHTSTQHRSRRDTTTESDVSDSEHSCSSVRSHSSRRSGVFQAATRRLMKSSSNRHALLGDGDVENDVVPFSW